MRKAFEKNVARRRPQLRRTAAAEELAAEEPGEAPPPAAAGDAPGRRERLEKIKRRVAELAGPAPRVELGKIRRRLVRAAALATPSPAAPAAAAGSALSRMEALGVELARAHERKEALRGELIRAAGEARNTTDRLAAAYADYLLQVALRRRAQAAAAGS